ncbi:MAG TPA: hypothetical protein DIU15_05885 [Deltaproteobacteria bacterium]|nr:hypothetical protein [Deltaproteobacteria bacterium]HCP45549.1 hypothetical protein [Deltaproteobacteria bacterium]
MGNANTASLRLSRLPVRSTVLWLGLALVTLTPATASGEGRVLLSASRTTIQLGDATQVEVEIEGQQLDKAPRFVESENLDVTLAGRASSFSMTNGSVEQRTTYSFQVTGLKEGQHTLGPAEAIIDGKRVVSDSIRIEVVPAQTGRPGESRLSPSSRGPAAGTKSQDWYALAELSDTKPYVGQSLTYRLEVGVAVAIRGMNWERPTWGSLAPEPGIEPGQSEHPEVLDGRRYNVTQLVVPLFALEEGASTIDPSTMQIGVVRRGGSFLQPTTQRSFSSNAIDLQVRPLPQEGRPKGFGGAVGRFGLTATTDRTEVQAGETISLTLKLSGRGSLRSPEIDLKLPEALKVYSEDPERRVRIVGSELRSEVLFREAVVPLEPGKYTIPSVRFPYFDPEAGRYRVATSQPIAIEVGGTAVVDPAIVARSAELTHAKKTVEVLGSDILPLHTGERVLGDTRIRLLSPWILVLLIVPLVGFSGVSIAHNRKRFEGTSRGQEQRRLKAARAAMKAVREAGRDNDPIEAERAVRSYLGARLDRSADAFSPQDGAAALSGSGLSETTAAALGRLLERCEAARYGGGSTDGLAEDLAAWTTTADKEWS